MLSIRAWEEKTWAMFWSRANGVKFHPHRNLTFPSRGQLFGSVITTGVGWCIMKCEKVIEQSDIIVPFTIFNNLGIQKRRNFCSLYFVVNSRPVGKSGTSWHHLQTRSRHSQQVVTTRLMLFGRSNKKLIAPCQPNCFSTLVETFWFGSLVETLTSKCGN